MPQRPQPHPGVMRIAPYEQGKSATKSGRAAIKLSSNESPLGASPRAVEALRASAEGVAIYPEGSSLALRQALGAAHGIDPQNLMIGAGSDELLHMLAQVYLAPGDEAVISEFGFLMYPIAIKSAGAVPVVAPDRDYVADVDALLAATTEKTRIVWLANPNNPTGTYLGDSEVRRLHAGLRPDVLLVIDNAYAEYVTAPDFSTGAELVREAENVVMVRTFSKIGLAGARVGWMFAPDHVIDAVNRVRGPFNVTSAGQAAAKAATEDRAFTQELAAHNARWRDFLASELGSNRIRVVPSQGNFVLALFDGEETAAAAFGALGEAGIVVREMGGYNIPTGLRISIGTEAAMRQVVEVLAGFMRGQA